MIITQPTINQRAADALDVKSPNMTATAIANNMINFIFILLYLYLIVSTTICLVGILKIKKGSNFNYYIQPQGPILNILKIVANPII